MQKRELRGTPSTQVLIAAWNEEDGIGLTIAELQKYLDNPWVVVVDGKSVDRTVEVAKKSGAQVLTQDGRGKGDALSKALTQIKPSINYVVITDADYTYPAEDLPQMIRLLDENPSVGMVCGNRFNGNVNKTALRDLFYVGNRLISYTHNLFNGIALEDPLTGLRVVRAEILRNWKVKSKGFDIEVELNHLVERKGFSIIETPIQYRVRLGEKKLKARHGATILKRILLETFY
jgi:dolichol-phosphate hexosyltransferase